MLEHLNKNISKSFEYLKNFNHIAIGVSGGADSLALMLLVADWSEKQNISPEITIYCVNHGLRKGASAECELVVREAKKLGLEAYVLHWQGEKSKSALQENARNARYRLIGQAMKQNGAQILLTAHHSFDQMETILMRMANGSGMSGMVGMAKLSQIQGVEIYRPLLQISPDDLAKIVKQANITPVFDPSNIDENYERVRWRKILPILFNLGLDASRFEKLSVRLNRADEALNEITNILFDEKVTIDSFAVAKISKKDFLLQSKELQIRLLQKILRKIGSHKKPYALSQIEVLLNKISIGEVLKKQTLHGCVIEEKNKILIFAREVSKISKNTQMLDAGQEMIWDNRFIIKNKSKSQVFEISSAIDLTKKDFLKLLAKLIDSDDLTKASQMQAAPIAKNENGEILMLGGFVFSDKIDSKIL